MKNQCTIFKVDLTYLVIMTLCSLFYVFADFGKAITNLLGLAQLIFSIIATIILISIYNKKRTGLPIIIYILYIAAQTIPIFWWTIASIPPWNTFDYLFHHLFPGGIKVITGLGLAVHLLLFYWGIRMIIVKKRNYAK